ncbi:MAG: haloacid dehalogenase [Nitrospirales bacterium]|nr:MAG: haloacid dehalogenase [Nitrospirales bacterium]
MKRTIILDVDGTLMDTNYLHVEAWARAFQKYELPIPRAAIHRQIGKGSTLMLEELLNDASLRPEASEWHSHFFTDLQQYGRALPGAKEMIEELFSQEMAIWFATSAKSEELDYYLDKLEAHEKLAGIVTSDDVEHGKPAPHIFQQALERSASSPDESIVVGDTIWDIQASRGCGLQTIAVLTGGAFSRQELQEAGAVAIYEHCGELLATGFPQTFPSPSS